MLRNPWLKWTIRLAIVVLVCFFVRRNFMAGWTKLHQRPLQLNMAWLALSGGIYLLSLLPAGLFWRRAMMALGQRPNVGESLRAYFVGHLGKYVPGKALVVIMRAGLVSSRRTDPVIAGAAVFVETLTMMSVGACLAAIVLPCWFREPTALIAAAAALALVAGLPTLPPAFRRLLRSTPGLRGDAHRLRQLDGINYRLLGWGWLAMAGGWLVSGLSLWAALAAAGTPNLAPLRQFPLYAAAVALATVAGFLAMIPGGLFVREAVLLQVLQTDFGQDGALVAAVLLRLVWLLAEVIISGILYAFGPRPSRDDASEAVEGDPA